MFKAFLGSAALMKLESHPGKALAEAALGVPAGPPKEGGHISTSKVPPTQHPSPETDREGGKPVLSPGSSSGYWDSPGLASTGSPTFALVNWSLLSHTCDPRQL